MNYIITVYIYRCIGTLFKYYLKHCRQFVWNIQLEVRVKAECYICHETLTKSRILSYKQSGSALSVLLYFTLKDVFTEAIPFKFNTFIE